MSFNYTFSKPAIDDMCSSKFVCEKFLITVALLISRKILYLRNDQSALLFMYNVSA